MNKLKKWQIVFLLLLIAGTIVVMIQEHKVAPLKPKPSWQRDEGMIFGTVYHTTYESDSSLEAHYLAELQRVDGALSMFNPRSTISLINKNESMQTDTLFREVFNLSKQISLDTEGDFDITVAPLVNAWGFGFKSGALPDSLQVDSILQFVGWRKVCLTSDGKLKKLDKRTVMDMSAVAKGYGVDKAAETLERLGVENYMVEIGGEIALKGKNPDGKLWTIGINRADDDSTSTNRDIEAVIELTDCRIATSGNYRNYYVTEDGRRLAHTINPHTGYPVQRDIVSSTVIAPSCAMADAYATAFMVMGLEEARKTLERHTELRAYFIYLDTEGNEKTWKTDNLVDIKERTDGQ
ncbi:MAG: FAD:protein FMN transferase [Prevotellaceae bacterium]|nr:FAD:protein FMN transferase [Prevotellaceae bacterium]